MRPATPVKSVEKVPDVSLYLLSAARAAKCHRTPSPASPRRSVGGRSSRQHTLPHHSGRISQDSLSEGVHYRAGGLGDTLETLRFEIQQRKMSQEDRDHEIQRIMATAPQEETAPTEEAKAPTMTVEQEESELKSHECCEACLIV